MKKDISNKTLAIFAIIAIVISFVGLLVSKENITGMASTDTGNVTLVVYSNVDINATRTLINFSTMNNNQINSTEVTDQNITVEVLGSTIVDIVYQATHLFNKLNGSVDAENSAQDDTAFEVRLMENRSCGSQTLNISYVNASIEQTDTIVTDCVQYANFTIGVRVYVPHYEPSGDKNSTLTFTASEH